MEVAAVLVLSGVLSAVGVPMALHVRETARRAACQEHLRVLSAGLLEYHEVHGQLPPAAVWDAQATVSIALHESKQVERITHENWVQLVLPYTEENGLTAAFDPSLPIGAAANQAARTTWLPSMNCPADEFHRADNPYRVDGTGGSDAAVEFARGNYAINGGTQNVALEPPTTASPNGDFATLEMEAEPRRFRMWGNGIAGINRTFALDDMVSGRATLIALEEIRSGIDVGDPRGVWALGQIGGSITWAHGVNGDTPSPNNQWPRSDDVLGCGALHEKFGVEQLLAEEMPCVSYIDANRQATARSRHAGGVYVAFLAGSARFIGNSIDRGLWHVLHSRETPADVLTAVRPEEFATSPGQVESPRPALGSPRELPAVPFTNVVGMTLVPIPAGQFQMGLPDERNGTPPDEVPPHPVRISQGYWLSAHEITNQQFRTILGSDTGSALAAALSDAPADDPVVGVTWAAAIEFCRQLSRHPAEQLAGRSYRLPTEAEWEFACRDGKSERYPWRPSRDRSDVSGEAAGITPALPLTAVGSYPPNALGLFDMRGNAWEWCSDWYARDYYTWSSDSDPQGPSAGYIKVVRGGDWRFVGERCHIDYPMLPPWKANPMVGFRAACDIKGDTVQTGPP